MPPMAVMVGDVDSEPESPESIRLVGEIDAWKGRDAHLDGLVDSWSAAKNQSDGPRTWWPDRPDRPPVMA